MYRGSVIGILPCDLDLLVPVDLLEESMDAALFSSSEASGLNSGFLMEERGHMAYSTDIWDPPPPKYRLTQAFVAPIDVLLFSLLFDGHL